MLRVRTSSRVCYIYSLVMVAIASNCLPVLSFHCMILFFVSLLIFDGDAFTVTMM